MKKHILAGLCILVTASLVLGACSAQTPTPEATAVDANAIYTQAAQTVQAGIAQTQAAMPQPTATETPAPTNTIDPGMAATVDPAGQPGGPTATGPAILIPTATLPGQATPLVIPTATQAAVVNQPAASTNDKCAWVSNSPEDNARIPKNASFDATIQVKNTGTTTWDNRYAMRFFAGEKMGIPNDYYVQGEVKPNENYTFQFTMKAPNSTGKKEALIVIQNPDGVNMCFINLPLEITE